MRDFLILVAVVIATATASVAFGDHASVVKVVSRYRLCEKHPITGALVSCKVFDSRGSGVVVGQKDGRTVIATCRHVVQELWHDPENKAWLELNGKIVPAAKLFYDEVPTNDIALITVAEQLPAVELDDDPAVGDEVSVIGYPSQQYQEIRQRVSDVDNHIWGNGAALPGHSGGGLFRGNRLAGIVAQGRSDGRPGSQSEPCRKLRRLLDWATVRYRCKSRNVNSPVVPPPPTIPDPLPHVPVIAGTPGPKGEPGERGLPGPIGPTGVAGPPGLAGSVPNIDLLIQRIKVLEERPITVQLVDGDGKVISEQTYAPGRPIKIQLQGK